MPDTRPAKETRKYPDADVKMLYARSAGRCAYPGCKQDCVQPETPVVRPKVIGKIAHIVAHSDRGPRSDASMPMKLRDCYENWLLLCPKCHDIVDGQPNHYTVIMLRQWKADVEKWVEDRLRVNLPNITFVELEIVCNALMAPAQDGDGDFGIIDIRDKIRKNSLSLAVHSQLAMGTGMARLVERFIQNMARLDACFPERLRSGFVNEYQLLKSTGTHGDRLFYSMVSFATGGSTDTTRACAGLAVLSYYFTVCDVFEK